MSDTPPIAKEELESILQRMPATIDKVDLAAEEAAAELEQAHPMAGEEMKRVRDLCELGLKEGWLAPREAGKGVRFGRLAKDMGGYAVDCVLMSGKALGHTHPKGEINIAFGWEGKPLFDGQEPGWIVYPPGSHHIPTVTGGQMLFVYFLPGGEVTWDAK